jgi:hypothetical protein
MTRKTAEQLYALMNGIGIATFFTFGLGGIAISTRFDLFWTTLLTMFLIWFSSKLVLMFADECEKDDK